MLHSALMERSWQRLVHPAAAMTACACGLSPRHRDRRDNALISALALIGANQPFAPIAEYARFPAE